MNCMVVAVYSTGTSAKAGEKISAIFLSMLATLQTFLNPNSSGADSGSMLPCSPQPFIGDLEPSGQNHHAVGTGNVVEISAPHPGHAGLVLSRFQRGW